MLTRRVLAGDEASGGLHSGRGAPGSVHEPSGPQSLCAGVDLQEGSGRLADNGETPGELVRGVLGLPAGKARLRRRIVQAPG
jgi:hypothetical protein